MTPHPNPANLKARSLRRVLAIDPTHRGFGFVVLEGPDRLVDWGVVQVREKKLLAYLKRIDSLIEQHRVSVIVAENVVAKGSRRGKGVVKLITRVHKLATGRRIHLRIVSRNQIRHAFHQLGTWTKYKIAVAISQRFPELKPSLPPRRKCYMSEDQRMTVFVAAALGLSIFAATSLLDSSQSTSASLGHGQSGVIGPQLRA